MKISRGFSLVELMVSLTIGLFLVLGLSLMFQTNLRAYNSRKDVAEMQNSQRMAMLFIESSVKNAGFFNDPVGNTPSSIFPALSAGTGYPAFTVGQSVTGSGTYSNTDTLAVRFVADNSNPNSIQGCFAQLTAGDVYVDVYSVSGGNLVCTESDITAGTSSSTNLINGLSGMNILYGVDAAGTGSVSQYVKTSDMTTTYWNNVDTVQVNLKFTNPLAGEAGQPATLDITKTLPYIVGL